MIYLILGGPATGKGTRSNLLAKELGIPHISTGDLLRDEAKTNPKIAKKLAEGELASNDEITELLEKRLNKSDCKRGYILDGFPRTLEQAYILDEIIEKASEEITEVIELVIPEKLAIRRVLERKECTKCGKMYGIDFPPKKPYICDVCGGRLMIRSDDTVEVLRNRIEIYNENSKPILDYYRGRGMLTTLDASSHPERIIEEIKKVEGKV